MPEADSWQWHIVLYTSYKLLSLHLSVEYIVRFPSPVGLIAWAPNRTLPNYPLNHSFDAFLVRAIELSNPISYAERSHDTHSATTWSINCAFRANATCIRALQIATEVVQSSTAYRDDAVYTTDSRSDLQWPYTVVHYVSVTWLKVSATRAQSLLAGSPYSEQWYCLITCTRSVAMSTSWSVSIIVSMQKDVRISFWIHAIHMTKIYQPPCLYPSTVFIYWQSIWNMRITFPVFSCNTIFCAGQTGISNTLNSVFVNIHCVSIKTSTFGFFYISEENVRFARKFH